MVIHRSYVPKHEPVSIPDDWNDWVSEEDVRFFEANEKKTHLLQPGRALRLVAHAARIRREMYRRYGDPSPNGAP